MSALPLGPYDLLEPIGKGGSGIVWKANHRATDVRIAIKLITDESAQAEHCEVALRREVQATAGLDHPGIIGIIDYGMTEGRLDTGIHGVIAENTPWLAMELATGGSLSGAGTPIEWSVLRGVLELVLDALAYAHARGIIHRDLKPANILLFGDEGQERRKLALADFGIAHTIDLEVAVGNVTVLDGVVGTPAYMAPEQFDGAWREYGPWTDLYALGCMAHRICSGRHAFRGPSMLDFVRQHMLGRPRPLRPRFPVPADFEGWLQKLLAKHPRDRFQCAADAARALDCLGNPATGPTPPGPASAGLLRDLGAAERWPTVVQDRDALETIVSDSPASVTGAGVGDRAPAYDGAFSSAPLLGMTVRVTPSWTLPDPFPEWRAARRQRKATTLPGVGLALYGLRTIPFQGRADTCDRLWTRFSRVAHLGEPAAFVVRGVAGVGKSHLARWLVRTAETLGVSTTIVATHDDGGGLRTGLPGAIVANSRCEGLPLEACRDRLTRQFEDGGYAGQSDRDAEALAAAMRPEDAVRRNVSSTRSGSEDERHALFLRYLRWKARDRPVVVWLDDVQWGLEAIQFARYVIAAKPPSFPVLFVLTAREEALDGVEARALEQLAQASDVETVQLGPLSSTDQHALIADLADLDQDLMAMVVRRTEGNPLFAVQLVGEWVQRGALVQGDSGAFVLHTEAYGVLPNDLTALWHERLEALLGRDGGSARDALYAAAVLGRQVDQREWETLCAELNIALPQWLLDSLIERRLALVEHTGWAFVHGMLCETLVKAAGVDGHAQRIHGAAARMLTAQGGDLAPETGERVGRYLMAAHDLERAFWAFMASAEGYSSLDRYQDARRVVKQAVRLASLEDAPVTGVWQAHIKVRLANVEMRLGCIDVSQRYAEEAVTHAEEACPEVLSDALRLHAQAIGLNAGEREEAERLLTASVDAARKHGSLVDEGYSLRALAEHHLGAGGHELAEVLLNEALACAEQGDEPKLKGHVLSQLCNVYRVTGRSAGAAAFAERACAVFERSGDRYALAFGLNALGESRRMEGRLAEAVRCYEDAIALMEDTAHMAVVLWRCNVAIVLSMQGLFEKAYQVFREVLVNWVATYPAQYLGLVHGVATAPAAATARLDAVDEHFAGFERHLHDTYEPDVAWSFEQAGDHLATVDPGRARRAYEAALGQWRGLGHDAGAVRVRGRLAALDPM